MRSTTIARLDAEERGGPSRTECDYLTQLDAAIGDGDHGVNMSRGFEAVTRRWPGRTIRSRPAGS